MNDRPVVSGVSISHPDRVLYPRPAITKLDLARYYESVAAWMVPHVADRPLTLVRCPTGLGADGRGACFYMKHSKVWAPGPLRRERIREKSKIGEYLVADSPSALVALVQMGILEVHTWNSRCSRVEQPDRVVLDLDPGTRVRWSAVVEGAQRIRELLSVMKLACFAKTTGGRGIHVVVPLTPRADWSECLAFARALAEALARRDRQFTTRFAKAGRDDQILIDYLRNNRTNTSVAAYSSRATAAAPVSMPLSWRQLARLDTPEQFTVLTTPQRLRRQRRDPWHEYWSITQTIPRRAIAALERL